MKLAILVMGLVFGGAAHATNMSIECTDVKAEVTYKSYGHEAILKLKTSYESDSLPDADFEVEETIFLPSGGHHTKMSENRVEIETIERVGGITNRYLVDLELTQLNRRAHSEAWKQLMDSDGTIRKRLYCESVRTSGRP